MKKGKAQNQSLQYGELLLTPSVNAAATIKKMYNKHDQITSDALIEALAAETERSTSGESNRPEAILVAQSHVLDALFSHLTRMALESSNIEQIEIFMKLGLKAQSQARTTLDALTRLKNPPVSNYVTQANIAHGPQQVNNAATPPSRSADQSLNHENKLLDEQHVERMDTTTSSTPGAVNSAMGTVEHVDRSKKRKRQV